MGTLYRTAIVFIMLSVLILNSNVFWENLSAHADASVTPSESWGVFFYTEGDIEFTINQSGLAVRILVPREFLEGFAENDTSFINSTITNDYYYYVVLDGAQHYPYKGYSPYCVEVHSPGYDTFSPPQKIFFKSIQAPRIAGTYNFTVFTATALNSSDLPDFSTAIIENLTIPVSMREDPGFISGTVVDPEFETPITAEGIVYAKNAYTNRMSKAYVNSTTGFFNITGLYEGRYYLIGSAGYCADTGYAYYESQYDRILIVGRGGHISNITFPLKRGIKIYGDLYYYNASGPVTPIRSVDDNAWFAEAGVQYLNCTVEAYFYDNKWQLVGEYYGACKGDETSDPFWINGTRYSGMKPGNYTIRASVFGYIQKDFGMIYIPHNTETYKNDINLYAGGVITCVLTFPQTPRELENDVSGKSSGALFGGNVLAEAYDENGVLRGITIMNYTYSNETVSYADETKIRLYILGFSEFYNKTYSGAWVKKDYGLDDGDYYVRVFLKGFLQEKDMMVTINTGSNSTASMKLIPGGVIKIFVESIEVNPTTKSVHGINWTFPGRFLRVWLNGMQSVGRGEIFDLHTEDIPLNWPSSTYWYTVEKDRVTIYYCGNNWSIRHIVNYGAVPSALNSRTYALSAMTYGYIQEEASRVTFWLPTIFVAGESPTVVDAYIRVRRGIGIEGAIFFMKEGINIPITEKVFVNVKVCDVYGQVKAIQLGTEEAGVYFSEFSIYGYYNYKPSGYELPEHFYYVSQSGFRVKDFGLRTGNYTIKVDEIGFDTRFLQTEDVNLEFNYLYEVKSSSFGVDKMGMVYGIVTGRNYTGGPVPLSWVKVSSDERSATSLDGNFRLFLLDGTYTIDLTIPGYLSQQRTFTIDDADIVGLGEIILEQSGLRFFSNLLEMKLTTNSAIDSENGTEYVLQASINSNSIDPSSIQVEWYSEKGLLNSTKGTCVSFLTSNETSFEDLTVIAKAYVPGHGEVKQTIVVDSTEIPEFPSMAITALAFAFSIVIALGSLKRVKTIQRF